MGKAKAGTARRREVRKTVPRPTSSWRAWLTGREMTWAIVWILTMTTIGGALALAAAHRPRYSVGQSLPVPIVPRVEFTAIDKEVSNRRAEDARDMEPAVYRPNLEYLDQLRHTLSGLIDMAADPNIVSFEQIPAETAQHMALSPEAFDALRQYAANDIGRAEWNSVVEGFISGMASLAILTHDRYEVEINPRERAQQIVIEHPTLGWQQRPDALLHSVNGDEQALRRTVSNVADHHIPPVLRRTAVAAVLRNPQPTYHIDRLETDRRRQARYLSEPPVQTTYPRGVVMLRPGTVLTQAEVDLIEAERRQYRHNLGPLSRWVISPARVLVVGLIAVGMWIYLAAFGSRILTNPMRGLALTGLILLSQGLTVLLIMSVPAYTVIGATVPTLLAAMILAIAYNQRLALAIGAILGLLIVVTLNLSVGVAMTLIVGIAVAVARLDDIRTQSKVVMTGAWTGIAMAVTYFVTSVIHANLTLDGEILRIFLSSGAAFASGLAAGAIVQVSLPGIQKLFKVTTSMALKDLNDASLPLLRRLAQEAPGTYQHSLRIADMAESGAEAIGANPLLCRVGAMYHDIGKMNKPAYFIENQAGGPNRHAKLSPAMSLLIIVGHVKDGIEMAREYRLPPAIRQFIETHHGTTLVEYFYHAAKQKRGAEGAPAPAEFEYRYPGPKPQTREAAILMLCDSCESAARSLAEPTPVRLEQLTHKIAMNRLMDGQFDDCNLTLRELHQIEEAITKTLCAVYHGRIAYPKSEDELKAQPAPTPSAAS